MQPRIEMFGILGFWAVSEHGSSVTLKGDWHPFLTYFLYVPQYRYIMWVPVLELKVALYDINLLKLTYNLVVTLGEKNQS